MAGGRWAKRAALVAALMTATTSGKKEPTEFLVSCDGAQLTLQGDNDTVAASCDGTVKEAPAKLSEDNGYAVEIVLSGLAQNLSITFTSIPAVMQSLTITKAESEFSATIGFSQSFTETFFALSLNGIDLASDVTLPVTTKFNYLSIIKSTLVKIKTANDVDKLELVLGDVLSTVPEILYQTHYSNLTLPNELKFELTDEVALSKDEFDNLKNNVDDKTLEATGCKVATDGSATCSAASTSSSGVSSGGTIGGLDPGTISDQKNSSSSSSESGSSNIDVGDTDGDGGLSTVLIVVIVIIVVIALALLFFIIRHLRSRRAANASSNGDDNMATLMSKDDAPAANMKGSFISNDEFLRTFRIEQSDVSLTKALGTSGLWMGEYQGNKVAIKRIEAEVTSTSVAKEFREQARRFATLSHPNIVSLIGVTWLAGTDFAVVAEFLVKGNLKTLLSNMDIDLDLMTKLQICLDVAQGLAYLHNRERNMCIKALSSRKVLLTASTECKLNLFDCVSTSVKLDRNVSYPYGTGEIGWLAPEVLTGSAHMDARKANIFSFGVLVCEILTRATPYQALIDERGNTLSDVEILKRAKNREQLAPHEGRPEFTNAPLSLRQVVEECLSYDAMRRPTADDLVIAVQRAQEEARTKSI